MVSNLKNKRSGLLLFNFLTQDSSWSSLTKSQKKNLNKKDVNGML